MIEIWVVDRILRVEVDGPLPVSEVRRFCVCVFADMKISGRHRHNAGRWGMRDGVDWWWVELVT